MSTKFFHIILLLGIQGSLLFAQKNISFTDAEQQWINNHPIVRFGYEKSWPPFEIYEEGNYTGINGEYIKLISKYTGIKMQPIPNITWKESLNGLKTNKINAVALAGITDDRSEYLDFTSPQIKDPLVIITRDDYPFVNGLQDLEYKTICLPSEYYTKDLIVNDFPLIKIKENTTVKECLLKVSTGQVDAYVGSLSVITYHINLYGFANLKVASPTQYKVSEFAFAVTKDWSIFRDIVNKVFNSVSREDKRAIVAKWVQPVHDDYLTNLSKYKSYALYLGLLFIFIFSLLFFWNRSLQKQIIIRNKMQEELKISFDFIQNKNIENKALLKENHHRVKNNLQMMQSMLNMQARKIEDTSSKKALLDANSRVMAMSLIQKSLFEIENFGNVNLKTYINLLLKNIKKLYQFNNENITIHLDVQNIKLNIDDVNSLGLIINELVVNSYKYAFSPNETGNIQIMLKELDDQFYFSYKNSDQNCNILNTVEQNTFGMFLIKSLMDQLVANHIVFEENYNSLSFCFRGTKD